ncbi:hypothetical protein BaRGS_00037532, partial [Batillaria attramentaria]
QDRTQIYICTREGGFTSRRAVRPLPAKRKPNALVLTRYAAARMKQEKDVHTRFRQGSLMVVNCVTAVRISSTARCR